MQDLLPHQGAAVLLDSVLDASQTSLTAQVAIRPGMPFHGDRGVPAHVGIEYMAQACGAFSGLRARRAGEPPRMGFLLGTRRYQANRDWFVDGEQLGVTVTLVYRDDNLGLFDCVIRSGNDVLARAQLVVAEARDPAAFLARHGMDDGQDS